MIENKKSYAKGMGLKSTIQSDSKVYLTSFGDGNNAKLEKRVEDNNIICLNDENGAEAFSAEFAEKNVGYKIENKKFGHPQGYDIVANNPLYRTSEVQQDMLGLKDTLEKRYFGDTATGKDNICIQVIHNILDIEKILAEYITNATYAVNNIASTTFKDNGNDEDKDVVGFGKFSTLHTFEQFKDPDRYSEHFIRFGNKYVEGIKKQYDEFDKFLDNPRFSYLGKAFFVKDGDEYCIKNDNECYHILSLLSGLRNWNFHNNEDADKIDRTWLYNLDANLSDEYIKTLNYMYDDIADELTKTFSKNSAANVNYIAETLGINPEVFAEQYFRFSIMKEQKNLGFTLTKLREAMLDRRELSEIRDNHKVFDTIRSKLYTMMDFVIFRHYIENAEKIEEENKNLPLDKKKLSEKDIFVINLRGNFSEDQKEKLYFDEAERLWGELGSLMLKIKEFRGQMTRDYKKNNAPKLSRILPKSSEISTFSKVMYALTMFLDGKEINDLLTTLINKFDNIQCFIKVMPLVNVNAKFVSEYDFFNNSGKIAEELKLIKSFARMGEPVANAKLAMMIDAIRILGTDLKYDEVKKLANSFFNDANGNKIAKGKHGMRNFIINNVINNKRFHYLIRYGNPENLHEIAKNEAVVRFVLGRIANLQKKQGENGKNQIDRYYEICIGKQDNKTVSEKIDALTKVIVEMNYDQFEKNRNLIESSAKMPNTRNLSYAESERIKKEFRRNNAEREKFKKVISLYLTVIYHILKNIVNINSRYVVGFHCVERDAQLYKDKGYDLNTSKYMSLTKLCLGSVVEPKDQKKLDEEILARAKESISNLETTNPRLYANYINYPDELPAETEKELDEKIKELSAKLRNEKKLSLKSAYKSELHDLTVRRNSNKKTQLEMQVRREKAKTAINAHLRNTKWNVIVREHCENSSEKICATFRNKVDHLEIARYVHLYINDISEVNSYFQLYHYIMQRHIGEDNSINPSGCIATYLEEAKVNNRYSDRLLKLLCVPFGYCIPRFKNLSIEALFDMNEASRFEINDKKSKS